MHIRSLNKLEFANIIIITVRPLLSAVSKTADNRSVDNRGFTVFHKSGAPNFGLQIRG